MAMEELRSSSYNDRTTTDQIESYNSHDLRCYSASYASTRAPNNKESKLKKGKNAIGIGSSSFKTGWNMSDPELQRKKRVMGYKVYDMEGKMKGSFRKSFRWIKDKCNRVVYGWV